MKSFGKQDKEPPPACKRKISGTFKIGLCPPGFSHLHGSCKSQKATKQQSLLTTETIQGHKWPVTLPYSPLSSKVSKTLLRWSQGFKQRSTCPRWSLSTLPKLRQAFHKVQDFSGDTNFKFQNPSFPVLPSSSSPISKLSKFKLSSLLFLLLSPLSQAPPLASIFLQHTKFFASFPSLQQPQLQASRATKQAPLPASPAWASIFLGCTQLLCSHLQTCCQSQQISLLQTQLVGVWVLKHNGRVKN